MEVLSAVLQSKGQGEVKSNAVRIDTMCKVLEAEHYASLVVFPAGALRAANERAVMKVVAPVLAAAKMSDTAVLFGVDAGSFDTMRKGPLPYFMVGWSKKDGEVMWRQRGNAAGQQDVGATRLLHVEGGTVAPIACGEIYSVKIREGVAATKPMLAVIVAHFASGSRHWASQDAFARLGVTSLRVAHAARPLEDVIIAPDDEIEGTMGGVIGGAQLRGFKLTQRKKRAA